MRVMEDWLLTPARVAIHLPSATAVLADLHLGYNQARQRVGEAVPLAGLSELLAPLASVLVEHDIRRLAIAGDLFEEAYRPELAAELHAWEHETGVKLVAVVPGNHDRGIAAAADLPLYAEGFRLGEWWLVHGDRALPEGPVVLGHWHPCLRWRRVTAPCYLVRPNRLILPAFSADARGVNVLHDRRWAEDRCYAVTGDEVLDFGRVDTFVAKMLQYKSLKR